jgi:hypothetical protein
MPSLALSAPCVRSVPNEKKNLWNGNSRKRQPGRLGSYDTRPRAAIGYPKTIEAPWTKEGRIAAEDGLKDWRKQLDGQPCPGVKVPISMLFDNHLKDMRREGRAYNIYTEKNRIKKNLIPVFGNREASSIRKTDITASIDARIEKGAKPAKINRELSALRRSLKLAVEDGLIAGPLPPIKLRKENNVRKVSSSMRFIAGCCIICRHTSTCSFASATIWASALANCSSSAGNGCFLTGMNGSPIIKIPGEVTKSGDPHTIPIYHPDMRAMVEMALATRNPECPYLFQYQGHRLKTRAPDGRRHA